MPNLGSLIASPDLYPRSTGEPSRVTQIPAEPLALAGTAGPDALASGVAQLGAGVATMGAGFQQKALVEAAQRKAQDQIDKSSKLNTFTQEMDTFLVDRMADTDYRVLPQVVRDHAAQQIHALGVDLTDQGRAFFRVAAGERTSVLNREAESYRQKRMIGDGIQVADVAGQQYGDGMLRATNEGDMAQLTMQYLHTLQGLADTGVISQPEVQLRFRKTTQEVNTRQVDLAVRTQPQAMLPHLLALADNQPGVEGLPVPPPTTLAQAIDETRKQLQTITTQQDHAAVRMERQVQKAQQEAQVAMRTRITELPPTSDSLAQYDGLLRETNDQAGKKILSENGQGELTTLIRTLRHAAASPPVERDDPVTERNMSLLVSLAERPSDFLDARTALVANISKLKPETWRPLMTHLEAREKGIHYSHQPGYQKGRQILTEGLIPQGAYEGGTSVLREEEAGRLRTALDVYDARIQQLLLDPKQGINGMNIEAEGIAREVKRDYLDMPSKDVKRLPVFLQGPAQKGIPDRTEAVRLIDQQQLPPHMRNEILRQWETWQRVQTPTGGTSAPTGTGLPAPRPGTR